MKKIVAIIVAFCVIYGIILAVVNAFMYPKLEITNREGKIISKESLEALKSFKVISRVDKKQTLLEAEAVIPEAKEIEFDAETEADKKEEGKKDDSSKLRYLLLHDKNDNYSENQQIQILNESEIRIVGKYQYKNQGKIETIPVINAKWKKGVIADLKGFNQFLKTE